MGSGFGSNMTSLAIYYSIHGDIARDQEVHNQHIIEQSIKSNLENRSDLQEITQKVDDKKKNPNFEQVTLF